MSERPFMQLYIGDYMSDTRHLTTEQHGAYLLLLMTMWRHGGSLPRDHEKLARIAGLSDKRWNQISLEVMAFFTVEDEHITQKRLQKEIEKARNYSASQSNKANAKWLKFKDAPDADASLGQMPSTCHHNHSHIEKKEGAVALYAFSGKTIRINQRDFDTWKASFIFVDLLPYLVARDEFVSSLLEDDNRRKAWMPSTASDLRNKNEAAKAKRKPPTVGLQFKPEVEVVQLSQEERERQVSRLIKRAIKPIPHRQGA
jgi:uncharacterized protein YdaU (DUF1376 family)